MSPREIVDAYLQGRLNSWGVYRRLLALGLSTATALQVTGSLPAAAKTLDLSALSAAAASSTESAILDDLVQHLAAQLERVGEGGPVRPLAATLARMAANNNHLLDCVQCEPLPLNLNSGNVNLNGALALGTRTGDLNLNLNGNIGDANVNLAGVFALPNDGSNGFNANVGAVNLNVNGNVGNVGVNLVGNLGRLDTSNGGR